MIEIDFIGGKMDNQVLSHDDNLPDFITFPVFPKINMWEFTENLNDNIVFSQEIYQRISNTYTYICVQEG